MPSESLSKRITKFFVDYALFIVILIMGVIIYTTVFNLSLIDYLDTNAWNSRASWMGGTSFELFNQTVSVQFEGYSDYSFYYVHWGHHFLNGSMPYAPGFGEFTMDGITNRNGAYIFPPLYAVFYGLGIMLNPIDNWAIGVMLSIFGYLTVFPTYGIMYEFTKNRRAAEAAAFTYMLSPIVLYHTVVVWLNTAPVAFFFFSGFYMLVRGRRITGTLLIVVAALFKQIAWFLGLALVIYLFLRWRTDDESPKIESEDDKQKRSIPEWLYSSQEMLWYILTIAVLSAFIAFVLLFIQASIPAFAGLATILQMVMVGLFFISFYVSVTIIFARRTEMSLDNFKPLLTFAPFAAFFTILGGVSLLTVVNALNSLQGSIANAHIYLAIMQGLFFAWWPLIFSIFILFNFRPSSIPGIIRDMRIKVDTLPFIKIVIIVLIFGGAIIQTACNISPKLLELRFWLL